MVNEEPPPPPPPSICDGEDSLGTIMEGGAPVSKNSRKSRLPKPRSSMLPRPRYSLLPTAGVGSDSPPVKQAPTEHRRESLAQSLRGGLSRLPVPSRRSSVLLPQRSSSNINAHLGSPPPPPPPRDGEMVAEIPTSAPPPPRGLPKPKVVVDPRTKLRMSSASALKQPWASGDLLADMKV